jgi:hypothetical protein
MSDASGSPSWLEAVVASVDQADWPTAVSHAKQGYRLVSDVFVMIAMYGRRWHGIARQWASADESHQNGLDYFILGVLSLRGAGQADRAEQIVERTIERCGERLDLCIEHARIAAQKGNIFEAIERWKKVRLLFPDHSDGYAGGVVALRDAGRSTEADLLMEVARTQLQDDLEMQLFMGFESLGDNCEFGLVQRHFRAEPLSLLRWSSITAIDLARGLECGFEQLDRKDNFAISLDEGLCNVCDHTTGFRLHYFMGHSQLARHDFIEVNYQRLRFLRDKLLRDLAEGDKIFLYKPRYGQISDEDISSLSRAVRRYGRAFLLCVKTTAERSAIGTVTQASDNLLIGMIDKVSPTADITGISFPCWLRICETAKTLVEQIAG